MHQLATPYALTLSHGWHWTVTHWPSQCGVQKLIDHRDWVCHTDDIELLHIDLHSAVCKSSLITVIDSVLDNSHLIPAKSYISHSWRQEKRPLQPKFHECHSNRSHLTVLTNGDLWVVQQQSTWRYHALFCCSFLWPFCRTVWRWRTSRQQDCVRICFSRISTIQLVTRRFMKDVPAKRM